MGSGPVPGKSRSGGLSASTTFKIAAAVASGSPDISGLNALKTACRTASYSAIAGAAFIEDLNPVPKLPGSMILTLMPKLATSPAVRDAGQLQDAGWPCEL
jgi:hypothetical protein